MDEEIKKSIDSSQDEGKRYKHISEKKSSFSVKKISRFIFFIIILICAIIVSSKVTQKVITANNVKVIKKMYAKMDEDQNISNYYEKKRWDETTTRETWRKGDNYRVKDTDDSGRVSDKYYIDNVYYVISDVVDDVNGVSTKRVTKMTSIKGTPPNPGLQYEELSTKITEDDIKDLAKDSKIKSIDMEGIECYQIYIQKANDTYFMRKSDNRVIREILYYKEDGSDEIKKIDTGVIEVNTDCVTDQDIALPDISGYEVNEYDATTELEKIYNNTDETITQTTNQ